MKIGLETGLMTTIHAYTNDQVLTDVYHKTCAAPVRPRTADDPDQDGCGRRRSASCCRN